MIHFVSQRAFTTDFNGNDAVSFTESNHSSRTSHTRISPTNGDLLSYSATSLILSEIFNSLTRSVSVSQLHGWVEGSWTSRETQNRAACSHYGLSSSEADRLPMY